MEQLSDQHLQQCNSLRHLDDVEARREFMAQCALRGLDTNCPGPIQGQIHPICRLPEETKRETEAIVRPIMRQRAMDIAQAQL